MLKKNRAGVRQKLNKHWTFKIQKKENVTRKLLELINEFGKFAGYTTTAQKSLSFLYTNNENSEREIQETITFTIATKK